MKHVISALILFASMGGTGVLAEPMDRSCLAQVMADTLQDVCNSMTLEQWSQTMLDTLKVSVDYPEELTNTTILVSTPSLPLEGYLESALGQFNYTVIEKGKGNAKQFRVAILNLREVGSTASSSDETERGSQEPIMADDAIVTNMVLKPQLFNTSNTSDDADASDPILKPQLSDVADGAKAAILPPEPPSTDVARSKVRGHLTTEPMPSPNTGQSGIDMPIPLQPPKN